MIWCVEVGRKSTMLSVLFFISPASIKGKWRNGLKNLELLDSFEEHSRHGLILFLQHIFFFYFKQKQQQLIAKHLLNFILRTMRYISFVQTTEAEQEK